MSSNVVLPSDLTDRLATLEHHVNENFFEVQRRLEELIKFYERAKINFLEVERKMVEFDQKLGERMPETKIADIESHFNEKMKSLEDILMLLELEVVKAKEHAPVATDIGVTPEVPSEFADRLRTLEEKFHMLEKLKLKVPVELSQHEPRLKAMENNIFSLQKTLHEEIDRLESSVSGRVVTEQSAEHFVSKMREEMDELRRDIEKARLLKYEIVEKERSFATRPDLEAFESRLNKEVLHIHNITDRVAAAERSVDTKLVDIEDNLNESMKDFQSKFRKEVEAHVSTYDGIEKKIAAEISAHHRTLDAKVSELDSTLRTELDVHHRTFEGNIVDLESALKAEFDTHRTVFDSKLADMEEKIGAVATEIAEMEVRKQVDSAMASHKKDVDAVLRSVQTELARIKPILSAEKVAALMERINMIERDLESRATATVTKEIAAFSEAIDRRFPDLISKSDFASWSRAAAERIQMIEVPDVSPLAERIDTLELRFSELTGLIREIAVRMPIVIE